MAMIDRRSDNVQYKRLAAARRTAWIAGAVALLFFVLSIVQMWPRGH